MPQKGTPGDFDFSMFDGAHGGASLDDFDFSGLQSEEHKDKRSTFAKGFDAITTPMLSEDRARKASAAVVGNGLESQPENAFSVMRSLIDAAAAVPDVARNLVAHPRETLAGAVEGITAPNAPLAVLGNVGKNSVTHPIATARGAAGGVVEGVQPFTDPLSVGLMAAGPVGRVARAAVAPALEGIKAAEQAIIAARAAGRAAEIPGLVDELNAARQAAAKAQAITGSIHGLEKAANVGMVARGLERAATAEHGDEAFGGGAQAALGAIALRMAHVPVPMDAMPHTAELPRLTGQVRPDFVVTPDGVAGSPETIPMQPAADGSFVRSVPAEYARRESRQPRGLLPEQARAANEFVVSPEGKAGARAEMLAPGASRLDAFDFSPLADVEPLSTPKAKGRRAKAPTESATVPAAIADFDASGHPIYSSDPNAVSVRGVQLDDTERHEIRRMLAEMENTEFTPHTFNEVPVGRGGSLEIVPGGGGAPVHQDILSLHGANASRETITDAMRKVLEGEKTAYGPAIREVARGRQSGRYRAMLPPDAGDLPQSGNMTDEDFSEFSRFVDRLADDGAADGGRWIGEDGKINPLVMQHLGGATAGAVLGGTQGDTTEQRIRGALIGASTGALLPAMFGRAPRITGLATLGEQLKAKGITPETVDSRISQLEPQTPNRPNYGGVDPMEASYQRILQQGGRKLASETGAIDSAVASHVGGAVAGGLAGAASGNTPEERITRGLMGAAAGAAAPGAMRILRGRILPAAAEAATAAPRMVNARVVSDVASEFPTSARPAGAPRQPLADPMRGIDPFIERFPEEVRGGIRQIVEDNGGFQAQRRGAVDEATTARLAEGVAVDLQQRLKAGTALNAHGVRAYANALATAQDKINRLSQMVARGAATDADLLALEAAKAEAKTVGASIMGGRAEAGRALAEFKVLARVMQSGNPRLIQDAANGLRGEAQQFAEAFSQLPADPLERYRWLQQQGQASVFEKARSVYYANILSGLKTHERNVLGNASNALVGMLSQPFGATADVLRSVVSGKPREVLFSELPHQAAGALVGIPQGIREALFTIKNGVSRAQLSGAMSAAEAGKLDLPRVEFGGGGANPLNWPGRGLDAADQFFRSIGKNQELYALAFRQARREGLAGARLQERVAHLTTGTDEVSQGIQQQADAFARRAVFQEKPGAFAQGIQMLAKKFPPLSFVIPFVKTPANIIRQGFEFSPAGFAMQAARAGGREGSQALGKAAAGSVAAGYLAYLAATGRLSGSGPTNPAERAQLMESGWRPDSIKIGNKWVSMQTFQPVSVPASVVANAFESWRNAGADAQAADKVQAAVLATLRSQLNQSFLSGLADLVDAVEGSGTATGKLANVAGRTASGFVPFSGAARTIAQAIDPIVRQPKGIVETVKAGLPVLSESVPSRMDRFGRDVQREGGSLRRAADPFNVSTETGDPVVRELGRLGVSMGMPNGNVKLRGVDLTPTRDDDRLVQRLKGQGTYAAIERLIASPQYQALPDGRKAEIVGKAIDAARSQGATAAKRELVQRALADPVKSEALKLALIQALSGGR